MGGSSFHPRLAELREKLASRTLNGKPKPGYGQNVREIRSAIAKIEQEASHGQEAK